MKKNTIFFGSGPFAETILERIFNSKLVDLKAVVTTAESFDKFTDFFPKSIEILVFKSIKNDPEIEKKLAYFDANLGIVASYGKIIPSNIIKIFPQGIINIHPSILPHFRGPSPIQSVILAEEDSTGVSLIRMDDQVDHGQIIDQESLDISKDDTYESLRDSLALLSFRLLERSLQDYINGDIKLRDQGHAQVTFTKKITTEDGHIQSADTLRVAQNKIKALSPKPGTFIIYEGKRFRILKASSHSPNNTEHLPLLSRKDKELYLNLTDGSLKIEIIQPEGKRPINSRSFINGYRSLLE